MSRPASATLLSWAKATSRPIDGATMKIKSKPAALVVVASLLLLPLLAMAVRAPRPGRAQTRQYPDEHLFV